MYHEESGTVMAVKVSHFGHHYSVEQTLHTCSQIMYDIALLFVLFVSIANPFNSG